MKIRTDFVTNSSSSSFVVSVAGIAESGEKTEFIDGHKYCEIAAEDEEYPWYLEAFDEVYEDEFEFSEYRSALDKAKTMQEFVKLNYSIHGDADGEYYETCYSDVFEAAGLVELVRGCGLDNLSNKTGIPKEHLDKLAKEYRNNGISSMNINKTESLKDNTVEYEIDVYTGYREGWSIKKKDGKYVAEPIEFKSDDDDFICILDQ